MCICCDILRALVLLAIIIGGMLLFVPQNTAQCKWGYSYGEARIGEDRNYGV